MVKLRGESKRSGSGAEREVSFQDSAAILDSCRQIWQSVAYGSPIRSDALFLAETSKRSGICRWIDRRRLANSADFKDLMIRLHRLFG